MAVHTRSAVGSRPHPRPKLTANALKPRAHTPTGAHAPRADQDQLRSMAVRPLLGPNRHGSLLPTQIPATYQQGYPQFKNSFWLMLARTVSMET